MDKNVSSAHREETASHEKNIFIRLLRMNRSEWNIIAYGCIACTFAGATQPTLAVLLLKQVLVRFCYVIIYKMMTVYTLIIVIQTCHIQFTNTSSINFWFGYDIAWSHHNIDSFFSSNNFVCHTKHDLSIYVFRIVHNIRSGWFKINVSYSNWSFCMSASSRSRLLRLDWKYSWCNL